MSSAATQTIFHYVHSKSGAIQQYSLSTIALSRCAVYIQHHKMYGATMGTVGYVYTWQWMKILSYVHTVCFTHLHMVFFGESGTYYTEIIV